MTKFINYYNLCSIADPKEFLGIAAGDNDATLITTLSPNIVIVVKVSTRTQLHSWSMVEKLSARVVYDQQSQKYVGVFGRFLRFWDKSTKDINKCKKVKFHKALIELVPYADQTYVLFRNGTCVPLEIALEQRKNEAKNSLELPFDNKHTFSKTKIIKMPNDRLMLTYFDRNNSTGEIDLVCRYIDNGTTRRFKLKRKSLDVNVAGYAIMEGNPFPMLLTIWSDKRLFILPISDSTPPENSPGNYVSMINDLKVDNPLSILGISQNFVAIYGANSGQEGSTLLLYNTQFKVIKAKQFFKVYFDSSCLWNVGEHIILAMGPNVAVIKYHMTKELLADLVGTQVTYNFENDIEMDNLTEEEQLQEFLEFNPDPMPDQNASLSDDTEDENTTQATNGAALPFENTIAFDNTVNDLVKLVMHVDVVKEDDPSLYGARVIPMCNNESEWFENREVQIITQQMEECSASEHEIAEKVMTLLIKTDLLTDLIVFLHRYSNIPEKMLVRALKYLLDRIRSKSDGDGIEEETIALQALLNCEINATDIGIHLRETVDYSSAVLFLEFLHKQLTSEDELLDAINQSEEPPNLYLELQVLRWFQACLNAYFQKLSLSKDEQLMELLDKWRQHISKYKTEIIVLNETLAVLYNLVERRKIFKKKSYSKWYNIEEVTLF